MRLLTQPVMTYNQMYVFLAVAALLVLVTHWALLIREFG